MSDKTVLAELHLPVWALEIIESEDEQYGDRADALYEWLDSFGTSGTPEVVIVDNTQVSIESALFDGDKSPSKRVMLVGLLNNVSKIKRIYATIGHDAFFDVLKRAQAYYAEERDESENKGLVSYKQWQEVSAACPVDSNDLASVIHWCEFSNPLCQVWVVTILEQNQ